MFVNNFLVRTLPISSTDLDSEKNLLNTVFFPFFQRVPRAYGQSEEKKSINFSNNPCTCKMI